MKSMPKWLLVPPAAALLVVLGPLSMASGRGNKADQPTTPLASSVTPPATTPAANAPATSPEAALRPAARTPALPRTPDFFEIGSALAGVLLLGIGGVIVLRKLRGGATPTGGTRLITLRQSLRLSQRQAVHAIEFDDRILLIGESERGLTLLEGGRQQAVADEAEVLTRTSQRLDAVVDDAAEDDGAVPKNLVIPRPANGPSRRLPTPPRTPAAAKAAPSLTDFRALLQKAGR
ncbi:MAG: flagellar biosynthetic protein FliO [Planctomycetes bacterium]|nr:flagellar biosynthetic protein FliO [Planctomycetota bacterium]